jgi:adenosylcobinamide-phosphate synthase
MIRPDILLLAMILDALVGDPDRLWTRVPHPVRLAGQAIDWADNRFNLGRLRREKGIIVLLALALAAAIAGRIIAWIPDFGVLEVLAAAILLAHRSLADHVTDVADGLDLGLVQGRAAVGRIVGRDTHDLDESAVSRAAIESAAESFNDGVIAPAFWFLVLGLPGLMVCKLVNTADSMIGHMNERYQEFGWAAARCDDLINWIPARISALLICLAGRSNEAWQTTREEAVLHRSPNAGWPETAMAAVLGIALGGPRAYQGEMSRESWLNNSGRKTLVRDDIRNSVQVLWRAWGVALSLILALSVLVHLWL